MKDCFFENINYLIKEKRDICNQNQLASKIGVRRQTIHSYAIKECKPTIDKLLLICEAYGITPNDILLTDLSKKEN